MKKSKIWMTIGVAGLAALMLAGCGGAKRPEGGSGGKIPNAVVTGSSSEDGQSLVYDVGRFTLELPEGWKAFPQTNVLGEKDAKGNLPIDDSLIYVSNKAKTEADLFSDPYISFSFSDPNVTMMSGRDFYDDVVDLKDVNLEGVKITEAFEGGSALMDAEWKYQVLLLEYDNGQVIVTIPTVANDKDTGISWEKEEVKKMIESLTIK